MKVVIIKDGIVENIIVVEKESSIDLGVLYPDHETREVQNAGKGYVLENDIIVPEKQIESWILNTEKLIYEAPKELPKDTKKRYMWDEKIKNWKETNLNL